MGTRINPESGLTGQRCQSVRKYGRKSPWRDSAGWAAVCSTEGRLGVVAPKLPRVAPFLETVWLCHKRSCCISRPIRWARRQLFAASSCPTDPICSPSRRVRPAGFENRCHPRLTHLSRPVDVLCGAGYDPGDGSSQNKMAPTGGLCNVYCCSSDYFCHSLCGSA